MWALYSSNTYTPVYISSYRGNVICKQWIYIFNNGCGASVVEFGGGYIRYGLHEYEVALIENISMRSGELPKFNLVRDDNYPMGANTMDDVYNILDIIAGR